MTDLEHLERLEKALAAVKRWKEEEDAERHTLWPLQMMHELYDGIVSLGLVGLKRKQMEAQS